MKSINNNSMTFTTLSLLILNSLFAISAHQIPLQGISSSSLHTDTSSPPIHSLPKPSRPLQWGTLNILSTTDTHGWVRGHLHSNHIPESSYSASLADILSFKEHIQKQADRLGVDVLMVDSGDTVDGNGFVDADTSGVKGHMARKLLSQVGYDLVTTGNHELYNYTVAYDVYKSYIPSFQGHYLSSNINITLPSTSTSFSNVTSSVPYGKRYTRLRTKNQGLNITAFGVLFGFDRADKGIIVQDVLEMINENWWKEVLVNSHDTDAFIIVGHMATRDKDWLLVLNSIRTYYPKKPVLIFSGHAHVRDCIRPDPYTQVLASGRYLETLGFTSINLPLKSSSSIPPSSLHSNNQLESEHPLFTSLKASELHNPLTITRRYIDNNLASYLYHSNLTSIDEFYTEKGRELQAEMDGYAKTFNLSFTFGTAPQNYYLNRYPMNHQKSLIKLYADKVFNTVVVEGRRKKTHQQPEVSVEQTLVDEEKERKKKKPAFLFNTGGARFDIFKGPFTRDDQFTVIPFDNEIWAVEKELDYDLVIDVVAWLNNLWGEPELVSLNRKIDGIVKRQNEMEEMKLFKESGTNGVRWDRKNEMILKDSIATSARRREEADEYAIFAGEDEFAGVEDDQDDEFASYHQESTTTFEEKDGYTSQTKDKKKKKKKRNLTFGYVTKDKCGPRGEGDDTPHRPLPAYPIPEFVLSSRPESEVTISTRVHLVFYEFIAPLILSALNNLQNQHVFSYSNLTVYSDLKANELLGEYAKLAWN